MLKLLFRKTYENKHIVFNILGLKLKFRNIYSNSNVVLYNGKRKIPKNIKVFFRPNSRNSYINIENSEELNSGRGKIVIHVFGEHNKIDIASNIKVRGILKIEIKNNSVTIGENCLIADDVTVLATDFHKIYSKDNLELLNINRPVVIGNNCWIGRHSRILKGAYIPNNSVVGIASIVNKQFEKENSIIAGIPAKVVRENVVWKE